MYYNCRTIVKMIIPIRCFTCGKVLADKWEYYNKRCKEIDEGLEGVEGLEGEKDVKDVKASYKNVSGKFKKIVFEELKVDKICCRRHLLTHVDLIDIL